MKPPGITTREPHAEEGISGIVPGPKPGAMVPLTRSGLADECDRADEEKEQPDGKGPTGYHGETGFQYVGNHGFHILYPLLLGSL